VDVTVNDVTLALLIVEKMAASAPLFVEAEIKTVLPLPAVDPLPPHPAIHIIINNNVEARNQNPFMLTS
jgi:hypothetical protein